MEDMYGKVVWMDLAPSVEYKWKKGKRMDGISGSGRKWIHDREDSSI